VENAVPSQSPVTSEDVSECVNLGVTHVEVAGRVREHVKDVLVRPVIRFVGHIERAFRLPHGSPLRL
jgi:hypothetical protein